MYTKEASLPRGKQGVDKKAYPAIMTTELNRIPRCRGRRMGPWQRYRLKGVAPAGVVATPN